ncbi:hypothetical protein BDF22DRAFT_739640 [Syncephalis plumigaleata]|nr:hypothetical protein BDF22DRAFT_739640 [Syncephalis plumigaleata]
MHFTERFKHTVPQSCQVSPSGLYIANIYQNRVVVRNAETCKLVRQWTAADPLRELHWSPDSELLLSPDSRHVLCFSDLQLRLTIWSLTSKEAYYIKYPKQREKIAMSITTDGRYMALAERKEVKDHIGIYDVNTWNLAVTFPADTLDLEGLACKIVDLHTDGRLVKSFAPNTYGLGIRSATWSPSSQFLAIGAYDQKAHLLDHFTWSVIASFDHPANVRRVPKRMVTTMASTESVAAYEIVNSPLSIPTTRSDPDKPNPRVGINLLAFDSSSRFLVTRNDNMSHCLWIWEIGRLRGRALIQQLLPIRTARWHPTRPGVLAFCCGNCFVYLWAEEKGCQAIELPSTKFMANGLRWSSNGRSLLLVDKDTMMMVHLDVQLIN